LRPLEQDARSGGPQVVEPLPYILGEGQDLGGELQQVGEQLPGINGRLAQALAQGVVVREQGVDLVLELGGLSEVANPDGTPLKPDSISASVSALSKRLKLPKGASLHTLRHTHGSHLIASGMDLATVSARLGHSNVRVTAEIYAHVIRGRDDEAAQKWEQFQRQNAPEQLGGVQ